MELAEVTNHTHDDPILVYGKIVSRYLIVITVESANNKPHYGEYFLWKVRCRAE